MSEKRNNGSKGMPRRGFLKYALGFSFITTLVGVLTPIIGYLWPPVKASGVTAACLGTGDLAPARPTRV